MTDLRFFEALGPITAAAAAELVGGVLAGTAIADCDIADVAPLDTPNPCAATFVEAKPGTVELSPSAFALILAKPAWAEAASHLPILATSEPKRAFAQCAGASFRSRDWTSAAPGRDGVSIDETAEIGEGARFASGVVIGPGAALGEGCVVGPNTVIGPGVQIGRGCWIDAGVVISHALLGDRVRILRGAMIGQDGFGFAATEAGPMRFPQLGRAILQDDVEIGACTTIDRGALGDTVIGAGAKIDNQVQIGHNVFIGRGCVIAAQSGVSGSAVIEDYAMIGGKVGVADHVRVGAGAQIAGGSGLMRDVPAGERWGGYPARTAKSWMRETASLARLSRRRGAGRE